MPGSQLQELVCLGGQVMTEKRRIMIVEDNPGTMNLLRQIVMAAGYEPVMARGGQEAIRLLREEGADLVLLDIMMKGVDGWTVLMTMKAEPQLSSIPTIVVSGKAPTEHPSEVEALEHLYEAYFLKPFEVDDLVASIAQVLER
jgi:DNA-binding response OmpR family regulator